MIHLIKNWTERRFDIEKINDETCLSIDSPFELQLHSIGVAVHSVAFVLRWNFRQTVRRLETECLCYFHGISLPSSAFLFESLRMISPLAHRFIGVDPARHSKSQNLKL